MQKEKLVIYWSRRDFRLRDNSALTHATLKAKQSQSLFMPLFVIEDYMTGSDEKGAPKWNFGAPQRKIITTCLPEFTNNFEEFYIFKGKAAETILKINNIYDVHVFVNEDVYIDFYKQTKKLEKNNITITVYKDQLTINKETKTGTGKYYSIFTPFRNAVWSEFIEHATLPKVNLSELHYLDKKKFDNNAKANNINLEIIENKKETIAQIFSWDEIFYIGNDRYDVNSISITNAVRNLPYINEDEAIKHYKEFLKNKIINYKDARDMLDSDGTSQISMALAWGLVSARILKEYIIKEIGEKYNTNFKNPYSETVPAVTHYITELIWREFYKYLLYYNPNLMHTEFQEKFRGTIHWVDKETQKERFTKWIQGKTGYGIVDAAMRELRETGFMHNRARMIVASVLTKNLGVDWRWGQEYFRASLLDLDEASNNGGWQWGASVGADPKPIRIFNPHLQAKNYDPQGEYQKRFLGNDYFFPAPEIVPHKDARIEALKRYGLNSTKTVRDY